MHEIAVDRASGNRDLIGWSWLYHHYVRPDLGISSEQFNRCIPAVTRTLRRYREITLRQLTQLLLDEERILWRIHRVNRIKTQLGALPRPFVGCEKEFRHIERLLNENHPHHFWVYGSSGIGKTSFVRHMIGRLIDADRIQHIVWINQPVSAEMIHEEIQKQLLPINSGGTEFTVRELTALYPVTIVIDKMDLLLRDNDLDLKQSEFWRSLLQELDYAVVILIHDDRRQSAMINTLTHVHLRGLEDKASCFLIRMLAERFTGSDHGLTEVEENYILRQSKGNPRRIYQLVQDYLVIDEYI